MGNSSENADKKSMTTSKNDKNKGKRWKMLAQKGKSNTRKMTIQLVEINQKVLAKEGKLKRYRTEQNNKDKAGHYEKKNKSTCKFKQMARRHTKNWKQNNFGAKCNNQEYITKETE